MVAQPGPSVATYWVGNVAGLPNDVDGGAAERDHARMGVFRASAAVLLLTVTSACSEPLPTTPPGTASGRESPPQSASAVSEAASTSPTAVASPECYVITQGGELPSRFPSPEEALAAFSEVWRDIAAEAPPGSHEDIQGRAIADTAGRAAFTSRDPDTATAEAPSLGGVATYQFSRSADGWAVEGISVPLPASMCELR